MINRILNSIKVRFKKLYYKMAGGGNIINGVGLIRRFHNFNISGTGNIIEIRCSIPKDVRIEVYGNNHKLVIENGVVFKQGLIWFEDYGCEIRIGEGTTIEEANLAAAGNGTNLLLGKIVCSPDDFIF